MYLKAINHLSLLRSSETSPFNTKATSLVGVALLLSISGCSLVHDLSDDRESTVDLATSLWSDEDKARLEKYPECKERKAKRIMSCIRVQEQEDRAIAYAKQEAAREKQEAQELAEREAKEREEWLKSPEGIAFTKAEKAKEAEELDLKQKGASICNSYWKRDVGQELVDVYRAPDGGVGCVFFMWHQGMVVGNTVVEQRKTGEWVIIN